jgi:hypothetical protein
MPALHHTGQHRHRTQRGAVVGVQVGVIKLQLPLLGGLILPILLGRFLCFLALLRLGLASST